jgi:pyruvate/2-oxoacid:ferredoxin oxidoreductase alpha subunit
MDPNDPYTFGGGVSGQVLYELRQRMQQDMDQVPGHLSRICREFAALFGRKYEAVEVVREEGADLALITAGTLAGTVKAFVQENKSVGLVKMRLFRPFPTKELRKALRGFKKAVVIDRNLSPGAGGIFAQEIKSALYSGRRRIPIVSVVGGLGGVDVTTGHLDKVVSGIRQQRKMPADLLWMES